MKNNIERTIISGELSETQKSCKHLHKKISMPDEDNMVIETCQYCKFAVTFYGVYPSRGKKPGEFKVQPFRASRVF